MESGDTKQGKALSLPFRPRARLLQLLGDQLIGSARLAVFELVKNAYDADAEKVTVTLKGISGSNPEIVVQDNGSGMSLDTIRDIWLVPAHDHRGLQRAQLKRTDRNRLPLGEKGVGRFAVHKLGDKIELVTRAKGEDECIVRIDWASLISKDYLSDATVDVRSRKPEVFLDRQTGTRITISSLREKEWSRGEVRRLFRQITSISSPFLSRSDRFEAELVVPDFPEWISGVADVASILKRAPWHFSFLFEDGKFTWTYRFQGISGLKLEPREAGENNAPLLVPNERDVDEFGTSSSKGGGKRNKVIADSAMSDGIGPVFGDIYVFDRDRDILSRLGDSQLVQGFLDENGGIRVYRDSIRVYNYGEPGDDWLGLDLRRVNTPSRNLSRNIVVGAIDISLEKSGGLTEKTNREGFVESDAYRRLRQVVLGAISVLEIERKIDKDNIRNLTGEGVDLEVANISNPLNEIRKAAEKHKISQVLEPLIARAEANYNEMRDTMLRAGISGMGLAIVFHEIEQGVRVLHGAIQQGGSLAVVEQQAGELVRILDGFSELLRKGEQKPHSLKYLLKRARDINKIRFRSHRVTFECPFLEDDAEDISCVFAFGLVLGALNNLLDNSFHWLQVRWPDGAAEMNRKIYVNVYQDQPGGVAIVVADNGPGLQDDPDRLKRPFFSRRPDGMGVGLYYASMVMELNNGFLSFPSPEDLDIPESYDGAIVSLVLAKECK